LAEKDYSSSNSKNPVKQILLRKCLRRDALINKILFVFWSSIETILRNQKIFQHGIFYEVFSNRLNIAPKQSLLTLFPLLSPKKSHIRTRTYWRRMKADLYFFSRNNKMMYMATFLCEYCQIFEKATVHHQRWVLSSWMLVNECFLQCLRKDGWKSKERHLCGKISVLRFFFLVSLVISSKNPRKENIFSSLMVHSPANKYLIFPLLWSLGRKDISDK
jgi:hypothetical protein